MGFEREHKPSIGERSMSTAVTAVVHGIIFAVVALSSNSSQPEVQTAEETSVFCRYKIGKTPKNASAGLNIAASDSLLCYTKAQNSSSMATITRSCWPNAKAVRVRAKNASPSCKISASSKPHDSAQKRAKPPYRALSIRPSLLKPIP